MTEAKLRSNLYLTDLPPGSPERATGKSAGGFRRGVVETPLRRLTHPCVSRAKAPHRQIARRKASPGTVSRLPPGVMFPNGNGTENS